jgi:hypothetical protein
MPSESSARRWPDRQEGPFFVRFIFGEVDDRIEIVGVHLHGFRGREPRSSGSAPVTPSQIRKIPWGELHSEARASRERALKRWLTPKMKRLRAELLEMADEAMTKEAMTKRKDPRGRHPIPPEDLAEAVAIFEEHKRRGRPKEGLTAIIERFKDESPGVRTPANARRWLWVAKQRGIEPR